MQKSLQGYLAGAAAAAGLVVMAAAPAAAQQTERFEAKTKERLAEMQIDDSQVDTSGNLLLRGAHGPIGFGFDIAVGLKGLFPLRPWPFEGGFAPVPPSWGHVEAILSSQHHRFML